jgi:hypothetical protein
MIASTLFLQLATAGWGILCGGMIYEHLAVVPQWASQPPASLTMWTGPHRLKAERFWIGVHPLLFALLAGALGTGWNHDHRNDVLVVLAAYIAILAITGSWFVPELMRLTQDPSAAIAPADWRRRARRWERLSLARGLLIVGLAWPLLHALSQTSK